MNFVLPHIPERSAKPRENGLTMMMDKGLKVLEKLRTSYTLQDNLQIL